MSPDFKRPSPAKNAIKPRKIEGQQLDSHVMSVDNSIKKLISQKADIDNTQLNYISPLEYQKYENLDQMKVHRGPLNLEAITMRDPNIMMDELCFYLTKLRVSFKRAGCYTIKCEFLEMKFSIEINLLEKFPNVFVLKFYKSNQATNQYFELCAKVYQLLQL